MNLRFPNPATTVQVYARTCAVVNRQRKVVPYYTLEILPYAQNDGQLSGLLLRY